jgi:ABC-type glycerol-3-phosphate transport system permease component
VGRVFDTFDGNDDKVAFILVLPIGLLGEASALSLIATLSVVILPLLVQRHLAAGLTLGAVK